MPICVIGMHRSGTSLVTHLLKSCGLELGPDEQLMSSNDANPGGYFENWEFVRINDAILNHFGGSWDNPPDFKKGWELESTLDPIVEQARSLLKLFSRDFHWGWKDPRTSILVPFWKRLIPDLKFVICVRSPLEVAGSLAKRDDFSMERGVYLWNRYMKAAIQDTGEYPRIFAFYEDFFADASREINRLLEFCGLLKPCDDSTLNAAISLELKHHTCETLELLDKDEIAAEYKLFYIGLRSLLIQGFLPSVLGRDQNNLVSESINKFFKLMEVFHNQEKVVRLEDETNRKENVIGCLKKDIIQKDIELERYQHILKEKEAYGERILEAIAQKDSQINQFQAEITRERQQAEKLMTEVTSFRTLIGQKEELIILLQNVLSAHQQELNRIHSSLGWKIVISYCKAINRIFPNPSRRRKFYDFMLDYFRSW